MMQTAITALAWFMALSSAIMAGIYFTFSVFAMRAFAELGDEPGARAMQSINRVIVRSAFLPLFMASSLASLALAIVGFAGWAGAGGLQLALGGAVYFAGMTLVTAMFNVPLNNRLDAVDAGDDAGAQVWADYLMRWTRWNHLRTIACVAALVLFIVAIGAR